MVKRTPTVPAVETICHALIGAGLGTFLALSAIVANEAIFNMIVISPSPKAVVAVFVGALSSLTAVGSAITGFIFCAIERN